MLREIIRMSVNILYFSYSERKIGFSMPVPFTPCENLWRDILKNMQKLSVQNLYHFFLLAVEALIKKLFLTDTQTILDRTYREK